MALGRLTCGVLLCLQVALALTSLLLFFSISLAECHSSTMANNVPSFFHDLGKSARDIFEKGYGECGLE